MFKMLALQTLYNLSDDQIKFQVRDYLSFQRFPGLALKDRVPDAKTLWLFREQLARHGLVKKLFDAFDELLDEENSGCSIQADAGPAARRSERRSSRKRGIPEPDSPQRAAKPEAE